MELQPHVCPQGHPVLDPAARFCQQCGAALGLGEVHRGRPEFACALHPDRPAVSPCPRCGTFACAECLLPRPDGTALCGSCVARETDTLPWDRRAQLGTVRAFFKTSWALCLKPGTTLATAKDSATVGSSLWFSVLASVVALVSTLGVYVLLGVGIGIAAVVGSKSAPQDGLALGTGLSIAFLVSGLVGVLSMVALNLVNAALDHLVLKLTGAKPKGFAVTYRACSLSLSPALVGIVPLCGLYVIPVWSVVVRVFAYRALHKISGGRAALGALLMPGLLFLLFAAGYVALIVFTQQKALGGG